MKKLTQKEKAERKARALYLRPLCNMVLGYISKLELKEAENLLKAINSTTPWNCAWIEHLLGRIIKILKETAALSGGGGIELI